MSLATETLDDLPVYYEGDPIAEGVVGTLAREVERLEAEGLAIAEQFLSSNADDTYGFLAVYESELGLPIAPPGRSVAQRQEAVRGALSVRYSPKASAWSYRVTTVLGTSDWVMVPHYPDDNILTLYVPFPPGSEEFDSVETLLRPFTPAALDLQVTGGAGFIVGVSGVGEETI